MDANTMQSRKDALPLFKLLFQHLKLDEQFIERLLSGMAL
jgi:hypothetical protein